jgi:hypothetical protein
LVGVIVIVSTLVGGVGGLFGRHVGSDYGDEDRNATLRHEIARDISHLRGSNPKSSAMV